MKFEVVYLAGPLTKGNIWDNVNRACHVAEHLRQLGFVVIIPHLSSTYAQIIPGLGYEDYLAWDLKMLERCDAVFRMSGESPGADREVAHAEAKGIPVFYSYYDIDRAAGVGDS